MQATHAYRLSQRLPVMGEGKYYTLTIRDLPLSEKPREKLLAGGPGVLSSAELLAVLFEKGTRKEDVRTMTERIIREYGDRGLFSQTDPKRIAKDLSIPIGKAMQTVALGELGRRFFRKQSDGAAVIRTSEDAYAYVGDMRSLKKETLRGLYLNAHYQIIHDEVISVGTVDASIVHPREVFRPGIAAGAAAIILIHNHPSGVRTPSDDDIRMTRQVAEAGKCIGIELVDHLIVAGEGFTSIPFL